MHYVYLTNNTVTDQAQIDPYTIFSPSYAAGFIEAPDEVTFDWKLENGNWIAPPAPDYTVINAQLATSLLQQTDWTALVAVSDPALSIPHLTNAEQFNIYRNEVRQVAINPPSTEWVPPVQPTAVWSSAPAA